MLAILETEEFYTKKWLRWRNESLECHVKDINAALRSSQSLLEEENDILFLQVHIIAKSLIIVSQSVGLIFEWTFFFFSFFICSL